MSSIPSALAVEVRKRRRGYNLDNNGIEGMQLSFGPVEETLSFNWLDVVFVSTLHNGFLSAPHGSTERNIRMTHKWSSLVPHCVGEVFSTKFVAAIVDDKFFNDSMKMNFGTGAFLGFS